MGDILTFKPSLSLGSMVEFTTHANIKPEDFVRESKRTYEDLYGEVCREEITLIIDSDGLLKRDNVRNVKAIIRDFTRRRSWHEVGRGFPNGKHTYDLQLYDLRETCKKGEYPFDTLIRGLSRELGYTLTDPKELSAWISPVMRDDPHEYDSSVYYKTRTRAQSTWFEINTPSFLSGRESVVRRDDEGGSWVDMYLRALPWETEDSGLPKDIAINF